MAEELLADSFISYSDYSDDSGLVFSNGNSLDLYEYFGEESKGTEEIESDLEDGQFSQEGFLHESKLTVTGKKSIENFKNSGVVFYGKTRYRILLNSSIDMRKTKIL